jgi:endonuclease/exonuclease/phosphatase family metal-dependent hydrolase
MATVFCVLVACARVGPSTGDSGVATTAPTGPSTIAAGTPLRVMTWNIEELGRAGTDGFEAVREVLARLDADIVGINELDPDELNELTTLATGLGYQTTFAPQSVAFGEVGNAMLSRVPAVIEAASSSQISGDTRANDVTRQPVIATLDVGGLTVAIAVQHFKSGFDDIDEFRRVVDATRTQQALDAIGADHVVVMGDFNDDTADGPDAPSTFFTVPSGAPSSYSLGSDLVDQMEFAGIPNDAFAPARASGLQAVDALQLDGRTATRDESDRRLDYVFAHPSVDASGEVYDARDDDGSGLPKSGSPPARESTATAADHFPVVVDFVF